MKITKIFLLVSLTLCIASCKKDNNPPSILGKWNLIKVYEKSDPTLTQELFRTGSYLSFSNTTIISYAAFDQDPFETGTVNYTQINDRIIVENDNGYIKIAQLTANKLLLESYTDLDSYINTIELTR